MPGLAESQRLTADQFRERQFTWLGNLEAFKAELLKEHQVLLESVRGKGYRWIPPPEQTGVAVRDFERDARRVFRTTGPKLRTLRHPELTDDQRRAHSDAPPKLAAMAGKIGSAVGSARVATYVRNSEVSV